VSLAAWKFDQRPVTVSTWNTGRHRDVNVTVPKAIPLLQNIEHRVLGQGEGRVSRENAGSTKVRSDCAPWISNKGTAGPQGGESRETMPPP
jgi:hypothetical protein